MKCSFCNKGTYERYTDINKRLIVKCSCCGLLKLKVLPDNKSIKRIIKLIERSFFSEYEMEKDSYLHYFTDKLEDIQKYSNGKNLLDVGCSTGIFLKEAKNWGYKGIGYEYSKRAVEICHKKRLNVFYRNVENLKIIKNRYNVITAFQILEHLINPEKFINFAYNALKENGLLVLTTPNVNGLVSILSGKKWFAFYNIEHFYFFSEKSLKYLLEDRGFKIIFTKHENGRGLSINYIKERLSKYYYFNNKYLKTLFKKFNIFLFPLINWHIIKEPNVNIYIIAVKINKLPRYE